VNILILYAHPEPRSLNGALKDLAVETLTALGHAVQVSDLYAMKWKAIADGDDFPGRDAEQRLVYWRESRDGPLSPDVVAEQRKLLWADAVILQFPLWWFSVPAILKGWFERVFTHGFAYGIGQHGGERWGDRYGEGTLAGKRALVSVTIGGRELHYSPRGVNGALEDVLFPLQHGTLFYPGMSVLEPFVLYQADRLTPEAWPTVAENFRARLGGLFTDAPIPFRRQNGGHYDSRQVLKPGLGVGGGAHIHLLQPGDPPQN
jgi:NAD(P)H dehydrogenase (quinone)